MCRCGILMTSKSPAMWLMIHTQTSGPSKLLTKCKMSKQHQKKNHDLIAFSPTVTTLSVIYVIMDVLDGRVQGVPNTALLQDNYVT